MKTHTFISLLFVHLLFHPISYSQTGWFTLNSGTTNTLQRVRFVDTNTGWAVGISGTILKTTNGGVNWFSQYPYYDDFIAVYLIDQNTGWAVGGTIVKTTNGGLNWEPQSSGTSMTLISVHFANANTGWVLSVDGGIIKTTNGGANWFTQFEINDGNLYSSVFFINLNTGWFAGGDFTGAGLIYKTTNGGASWFNQYNGPATIVLTGIIFTDQNFGYAAGYNGAILKTTNSGTNWVVQNSGTTANLNSVYFVSQSSGWIPANNGLMLKTTNGGANWTGQNISGNNLYWVFFIDQITGWTIGPYGTILKTTNGGTPVGITPLSNKTPEHYSLYQNYPNPFNPSTFIKFDIPEPAFVLLTVYNALGKEISSLVNNELNAGEYKIEFYGLNIPSGIYFYRLSAGQFQETRKFILIK